MTLKNIITILIGICLIIAIFERCGFMFGTIIIAVLYMIGRYNEKKEKK